MIGEPAIEARDPAQPAQGDDRALLRRLARACRSGAVEVEADAKHLGHIHSPVLSQADGNQWLYSLIAVGAALWWALGWRWAAVAAILWFAAYLTIGRRALGRRLMRRIDRLLDDPAAWNTLWSFGGVTLRDGASDTRCAAPEEDWRGFVRSLQNEKETQRMIGVLAVDHVQVTVSRDDLPAAKRFYGEVLGLEPAPRPGDPAEGAWYQIGPVQLHLALEDRAAPEANRSRRHVCYRVRDLAVAEERLRTAGVGILPDRRPIPGVRRFFVEDPGGNRIEIAAPE
jgi:catechol 2,3-dioxygenase-like lactoylglutathione lyase family enzyme